MPNQLNIKDLKNKLPLIMDKLDKSESIVLTKGNKNNKIAKLVPLKKNKLIKRQLGKAKGKIKIAKDFDELPEELLKSFGVE